MVGETGLEPATPWCPEGSKVARGSTQWHRFHRMRRRLVHEWCTTPWGRC